MQPDNNDIVYSGYDLDFFFIGRQLFDIFGFDEITYSGFVTLLHTIWQWFSIFSFALSFILMIGVVYAFIRNAQVSDLETEEILLQEKLYQELYGGSKRNTRFEDIQQHITTDNPNDWKLAIIEADVMLEEVLDQAGLAGLTIGEKLKSASPASFQTLDAAWRAHKVRNQIAHGGPDFILTKKLAQETITQYTQVFREFGAV